MITQVRLTNFKSFADTEDIREGTVVDLDSFTLVLGTNGAGKSNFFDALRLLRSIGEHRSVRDALEGHALPGAQGAAVIGVRGGAISIPHQGSSSSVFRVAVRLLINGMEHEYAVQVDALRQRVVAESLWKQGHPGDYVFDTHPVVAPLQQDDDRPTIAARTYKKGQGSNPKSEFSPHEFLLYQLPVRRGITLLNVEVAEAVLTELRAITLLELRPEVLRQYSPLGRSLLGEHGENFAAAVHELRQEAGPADVLIRENAPPFDPAARRRLDAVQAWLSDVTPRPITELLTQLSPTREAIVAVREEPFDEPIAAPSLSDGTLRFAALALASVGTAGARTLVVEELENGMNPTRISLLMAMLHQATEAGSGVQVIASTHSPAVLDLAPQVVREAAVVIGWDDDLGSSRPVRVTDLPSIEAITEDVSLGQLQTEGWLQEAASA